jgi:hypothetical protein
MSKISKCDIPGCEKHGLGLRKIIPDELNDIVSNKNWHGKYIVSSLNIGISSNTHEIFDICEDHYKELIKSILIDSLKSIWGKAESMEIDLGV